MWGGLGVVLRPVLGTFSKTLTRLDERKVAWTDTSCQQRAQWLRECMRNTVARAHDMAEASTKAKGHGGGGIGDELLVVAACVGGLQEYAESMDAGGQPSVPTTVRPSNGQLVAEVFPRGPMAALFPGSKGEVFIQRGKPATQGAVYRAKQESKGAKKTGGVALVLGAGNQMPVVFMDLLHKMIADDEVVIVKMSPVNDYLGPILQDIFAPLVQENFLAFVYGGIEVSQHLTQHSLVTSIHLTGSKATYDAIVATPKVAGKPVSAELGNVTPYLIVPGPWTDEDMAYHAKSIAWGLTQNCCHNCIGLELLVTDASWPQRSAFLAEVKKALQESYRRKPFYPGSDAKIKRFRDKFEGKQVNELGASSEGDMADAPPWLMVEGLSPDEASAREENWCGVMQEVCLPGTGGDPSAFMKAATQFANERCFGSLSVGVWIHPDTQKEHGAALTQAIDDLQYGSISVNVPTPIPFVYGVFPWGAHNADTEKARESGVGFVHNTLLLDHPEKSCLSFPWRVAPKPVWHADNRAVKQMSEQLVLCIANFGSIPLTLYRMTLLALASLGA